MRNKVIAGVLCVLVLEANTWAQRPEKPAGRHALYADLLGPGGLFSVGYEYFFFADSLVEMRARSGAGGYFSSNLAAVSLPFEILFSGPRHRRWTWETGAAFTPFFVSGQGRVEGVALETGPCRSLGLAFRAGLRFRLPHRLTLCWALHPHWMIAAPTGPVFRAAFPMTRGFVLWGSVGLTWSFR